MLTPDQLLVEQTAVSVATGAPGGVVGRVIEAGEPHAALVGKTVVVAAPRSCGACFPCRRGKATLCRTPRAVPSFEPRLVVPARIAVPIDADAAESWPLAALADVGLWAYAAVIVASVEPNRAAFVLGHGPLARFVAALVVHRGARAIVEPPDDLESFGLPVIALDDAESALRICPDGGTVVLCSRTPGQTQLDAIPTRAISIHGVLGGHPDLLPELLAFAKKGALDVASLCRRDTDAADDRAPVRIS